MLGQMDCFGSGLDIVLKTKSLLKMFETRTEIYRKTLVNAHKMLRDLQPADLSPVQSNRNNEKLPFEKNHDVVEALLFSKQYTQAGKLDTLKTLKQKIGVQRINIFAVFQRILDFRKVGSKNPMENIVENKSNPNENKPMRDAIAILPEEIWKIILEYLTELKDIQACYRTCTLFWKILNSTIDTWLFPEVFPHVVKYLNNSEVNTCRLFSKYWSSVVSNEKPRSLHLEFPLTPSTKLKLDKLKDIMSGSYLAKYFIEINFEDDNVAENQDKDIMVEEICGFFDTHGSTITNLEIHLITSVLDNLHAAEIIIKVMEKCSKLKKITVNADTDPENEAPLTCEVVNELLPPGFKVPVTLTELKILGYKNLGHLQSRILQDCQYQLEVFQFDEWITPEVAEWPNLTTLRSSIEYNPVDVDERQMKIELLKDLMCSSIPNLCTLEVSVNQGFLEYLLETTNRFSKLENLYLYQNEFSGFLSNEYIDIPAGLIAPASVKKLRIHVYCFNGFLDLSFLLLFPFTETLEITYNLMDVPEILDKIEDFPKLLEISDLLEVDRVFVSDIWKFLPFLKRLEVGEYERGVKLLCYTRSEYNTYMSK